MSKQSSDNSTSQPSHEGERCSIERDTACTDDAGLMIDVYEAKCHPITQARLPLLHELTVGVYWPHRARDLDLFIKIGGGYLALDEVGRPLASSMQFSYGDDFAMIGMMTTAPRLQSRGTGRWLLNKIMDECSGRDLRLTATRAGYRLYESSGFVPVATVQQQQGVVRNIYLPEPAPKTIIRTAEETDWVQLLALDAHAFGADRSNAIVILNTKSECLVAEKSGKVVGFAMIRNFGKGKVIGPVVAESDQMAMQLIAPMLQENEGQFVRLDTPVVDGQFSAFLAAAGLGVYDTVTEMRVGRHRRAEKGAMLYGLAAHTLG